MSLPDIFAFNESDPEPALTVATIDDVAPLPDISDDVPPAGTACAGCKGLGHWCQAMCYLGEETPLCLACANGEDCGVIKARLQHEDELLGRFNVPAGAVMNVTPVDPAKRIVAEKPPVVRRVGFAIGRSSDADRRRAESEAVSRRTELARAARVVAPKAQTPRAREIDVAVPEKETKAMATQYKPITDEIKERIRALSAEGLSAMQIAKKLNAHPANVGYWKTKFNKEASSKPAAVKPGKPAKTSRVRATDRPLPDSAPNFEKTIATGVELVAGLAQQLPAAVPDQPCVTLPVTFTVAGVDGWWSRLTLQEKARIAAANIAF